MRYEIKWDQELLWAVAIAVGTYLVEVLARLETDTITDPRAYVIAAAVGSLRVVIAVVGTRLTGRGRSADPEVVMTPLEAAINARIKPVIDAFLVALASPPPPPRPSSRSEDDETREG